MDPSLQILVAEDNEDDAFILTRALQAAGLPRPAYICKDGQQVIDYITGSGSFADRGEFPFPRMLILDIKMPRLNGLEVLRWVRAHPDCAVIPTIILTSSAHPKDVEEAFKSGVNAYFLKPPTPEEMEELLTVIHKFWNASVLPVRAG